MTTDTHTQRLLITGATGGMGRACALLAARDGHTLILADLAEDKLAALADECRQLGVETSSHLLDVTDGDHIDNLVSAIATEGGIDAIIHTVGISPTMAGWEKIVEVDLIGTAKFLEAVRPQLASGGAALCITSMSAYMNPPHPALEQILRDPLEGNLMDNLHSADYEALQNPGRAYAYAKQGLLQYVEANALAWGREGKRLVSLAPGLIDTDMGRQENDANRDQFAAMLKMVSLGRLGKAEEIAGTALFLVSPRASYISGCDILVDGGFVGTFKHMPR